MLQAWVGAWCWTTGPRCGAVRTVLEAQRWRRRDVWSAVTARIHVRDVSTRRCMVALHTSGSCWHFAAAMLRAVHAVLQDAWRCWRCRRRRKGRGRMSRAWRTQWCGPRATRRAWHVRARAWRLGSAPEATEDKEPPEVLLKVSFISMFVLRAQEESAHGGARQHRLHHEVW